MPKRVNQQSQCWRGLHGTRWIPTLYRVRYERATSSYSYDSTVRTANIFPDLPPHLSMMRFTGVGS
jgi:hypothetical protein